MQNARRTLRGVFSCLLFLLPSPVHALTALFTDGTTLASLSLTHPFLYAAIEQGMADGAAVFTSRYTNPVTVRLTVDIAPAGFGALMGAGASGGFVPYSAVQERMPTLLPTVPPIFSTGGIQVPIDTSRVWLTSGQMKALSVFDTPLRLTQNDGTIYISLENTWDFDPRDGISTGTYDFAGLFAHEIGHGAMGFLSVVDAVQPGRTDPLVPTLLDYFRYSAPGVRSLAPEPGSYFSDDGGISVGQLFEPGVWAGGGQSSHWSSIGETMSVFAVAGTEIHFSR